MRSWVDHPESDGPGFGVTSAGISAASSGRMTGLGRVTAGFNPVARSR